jgi:hypothetical protein
MAQSTELRDQTVTGRGQPAGAEAVSGAWAKLKLIGLRSLFWTYRRGSWQYDVIVLVILGFIFLTPRSWYTPQPAPQVTGFLKNQGIIELGRIQNDWSYIVDARLVTARAPQKPEEAVHDILALRLGKPVAVKSVDEIRDKNRTVIGYTVVVQP